MKIPLRLAVAVALLATAMISTVSAATLYVSLESTNPIPPFASWETAATNIQDAVDAAKMGDTVLVTNGVYAVGSRDISWRDTNSQPPEVRSAGRYRVAVTKAIALRSINGPSVTTIEGEQITNQPWGVTDGLCCVYLGNTALLDGFTLAKGFGSGVWWREGLGGGGVGNITGPPLFMDMAAGDFRLREDSPCIDAGTNLVGLSAAVTKLTNYAWYWDNGGGTTHPVGQKLANPWGWRSFRCLPGFCVPTTPVIGFMPFLPA